jgi:hypothetical protein
MTEESRKLKREHARLVREKQSIEREIEELKKNQSKPRCGLCGKTENLTRTECCGNWICDDEDKYVLFSYATNSCHRNHRRYTLCGYHFVNDHKGRWQDCPDCHDFKTEMYVWYGTNEYNFEKLENPPKFRPTFCRSCHKRIRLGTDGHTLMPEGFYLCESCAERKPGRFA